MTMWQKLLPFCSSRKRRFAGAGTAIRIRRCLRTLRQGRTLPPAAIMNYSLGPPPQTPVGIEILDASGATVRHYSSADAPLDMKKLAGEHPIPMYWVRPEQIPSATPGMHRFVWDLRGSP